MTNTGIAPGEGITRRHVIFIALLACVAMFEGFDISVTSVVLPYLAGDFHASSAEIGNALAAIGMGAIVAWLFIRLADRFGRRPVLLLSTAGFSLGSLATAFADGLWHYAAIQFVTRALLVTQISMAYLIVAESFPPRWRGRANGMLGATGSFGAAIPFLLVEPALESYLGWRTLFLVGALPLLMMPLLIFGLKETPVYQAARTRREGRMTLKEELRQLIRPPLRRPFLAMCGFWFLLNFASGSASLFFTVYVVHERGWKPGDLTALGPGVMAGAFFGYLMSGILMDAFGRKVAATLMLIMIGGLAQMSYSSAEGWIIAAGWIGLQATLGVWIVGFTLNSELFPTHLRAAANGWCNNLIGRWGFVIAPMLLGWLSGVMGSISSAVLILSLTAFLAIPFIWIGFPETRASSLES